MSKTTKDYWDKRIIEQDKADKLSEKEIEKKINRQYQKSFRNIEDDIMALFNRYAVNNNLTYHEALKNLTSKEFSEWRMDLKDYIKEIEKTGNEKLLIELNTLSTKAQLSRLEEMQYHINKDLNTCFTYSNDVTRQLLERSVVNAYKDARKNLNSHFNISKGTVSTKQKLFKILEQPWSGKNFSGNIWTNRDKVAGIVQHELVTGLQQGRSSQRVAKAIRERVEEGSKNDIMRIVRTERNFAQNEAKAQAYLEAGFENYKFKATAEQSNT